jgi:hypothetical protein
MGAGFGVDAGGFDGGDYRAVCGVCCGDAVGELVGGAGLGFG